MIGFARRLRWLANRREKEEELSAELRFHLDEEAEERREAGMAEAEAKLAARRDFGNSGLVKEDTRAAWGWTQAERIVQDLRFAGRLMRRNPGFVALALISLALGTGANTALYSFMDALLFHPLPVADPARLAVINWHIVGRVKSRGTVVNSVSGYTYNDPKAGKIGPIFPWPAYELLRSSTDVFTSLFAYRDGGQVNVAPEGQPADIAQAEYISGNFFSGLGLRPAAGRLLVEDDDGAAAHAVVVLSYAFAHARFGDIGSATGRRLTINNVPFTAIGVAPAGFSGVDPARQPDVFLPMHSDLRVDLQRRMVKQGLAEYADRHYYWIETMGRLRPGVTIAQAQAALAPRFHGWAADTATNETEAKSLPELLLKPGENGLDNLRRMYSLPLYVLMAMAGLILAIACANIANLLLARSTARRHEMAVRLGMGAGRWRIVRQLLTESLIAREAWGWPVVPEGQERPKDAPSGHGTMPAASCHVLVTGPGFFSAMEIPMVAGREFDDRDRLDTPPVAIVNQAWLRLNLPGVNPIGRRVVSFATGEKPVGMEIVGVAKNAKYDQLTDDDPATVYLPYLQNPALPLQEMTYFMRTAGDPLAAAGKVREIMREEDARIPVTNVLTEAGQIASEMGEQILFARLCTVLALLALAIACVGLYGTVSYSVARRTREIGIRMALGARRGTVLRMVMADVLLLLGIGLAIGVPIALSASKLVESFLFGVKPGDPVTMAAAAGILAIAAFVAGYIPARKASLTDPMIAVRSE